MKLIAVVIRGKQGEAHNPALMEQHADVVLSTGEPMGFFGSGGGPFARSGMLMDGVVADYGVMQQIRPFYVEAKQAQDYDVVSTLCYLQVTDEQAARFDAFWKSPDESTKREMKSFSLVGDNCSTAASMALRHAGILGREIPGLDSPDALYHQLKTRFGMGFACQSGYVGFERMGNRFKAVVLPPVKK